MIVLKQKKNSLQTRIIYICSGTRLIANKWLLLSVGQAFISLVSRQELNGRLYKKLEVKKTFDMLYG